MVQRVKVNILGLLERRQQGIMTENSSHAFRTKNYKFFMIEIYFFLFSDLRECGVCTEEWPQTQSEQAKQKFYKKMKKKILLDHIRGRCKHWAFANCHFHNLSILCFNMQRKLPKSFIYIYIYGWAYFSYENKYHILK